MNDNKVTFAHSFGVAHIPKAIKMFIGNKIVNIFVLDLLIASLKTCLKTSQVLVFFRQANLKKL